MDHRLAGCRTWRWVRKARPANWRPPRDGDTRKTRKHDQIRLVIADDHALFRGGLKSLLRHQRDMRIVAEAESVSELTTALAQNTCDVLLLDLQMERSLLSELAGLATVTKVLVLTASESTENAIAAMRFDARAVVGRMSVCGYVLIEAIRGDCERLGVDVSPTLQGGDRRGAMDEPETKHLTAREPEIVCSVALRSETLRLASDSQFLKQPLRRTLNKIFQEACCTRPGGGCHVCLPAWTGAHTSPERQ